VKLGSIRDSTCSRRTCLVLGKPTEIARIRLERLTAPPFSTPIYLVFCNFLRPHPGKHARNSRSCPRTGAAEYSAVPYTSPADGTETTIVGPMRAKSEIIRPQPGELLGIGTHHVIIGNEQSQEISVTRLEQLTVHTIRQQCVGLIPLAIGKLRAKSVGKPLRIENARRTVQSRAVGIGGAGLTFVEPLVSDRFGSL